MDELDPGRPPGSLTVDTDPAFTTPWLTVRRAQWQHRGTRETWHYVDHPGCALVVPLLPDGRVVLVRHWRIPIAAWCWELPAGRIETTETAEEAARRELAEEIGGRASRMIALGSILASSGTSNERIHLFVAPDLELSEPDPDDGESLVPSPVSAEEARSMVLAGQIEDGASALALLWAAALEHL